MLDGGLVSALVLFMISAVCFFIAGGKKTSDKIGIMCLVFGGFVFGILSEFFLEGFSYGSIAQDNNFVNNDLAFAVPYENVGSVKIDKRTIVIIQTLERDSASSSDLRAYIFDTGSEPPNGLFVKTKNEAGTPVYVPFPSKPSIKKPDSDLSSLSSDSGACGDDQHPNCLPNPCLLSPPPPWCP